MKIRPLARADVDALYTLEAAANAFPWSRGQFEQSLESEFGWAWEDAGGVQGFALFAQVLDEATLLNLVVNPAWQRRGMGRGLLSYALDRLPGRGAQRCLLEVRVGNAPAIALYRGLGFMVDGYRRDYYPTATGREDALLMSRGIQPQETN